MNPAASAFADMFVSQSSSFGSIVYPWKLRTSGVGLAGSYDFGTWTTKALSCPSTFTFHVVFEGWSVRPAQTPCSPDDTASGSAATGVAEAPGSAFAPKQPATKG